MTITAVAEPGTGLVTRSGLELRIRPVTRDDKPLLVDFFARLTPEDLRFRFLSPIRHVSGDTLTRLTSVDHELAEDFLAFDEEGELAASAVIAGDAANERAEVAVSVRSDLKGRGIGWTMLDFLARVAAGRGYREIVSIESSDNRETIALESEMGFRSAPCEGDPRLVLVSKTLG